MTKLLLLPALSFWVGIAAGILIGRLCRRKPKTWRQLTAERLHDACSVHYGHPSMRGINRATVSWWRHGPLTSERLEENTIL